MTGLAALLVGLVGELAVAVRVPARARRLTGTGALEWRETALTLSWSDRRAVERAANRGRQAPRRLAALVVQRAQVGVAVADRIAAARAKSRLLWRLVAVVFAAAAAINAADALLAPADIQRWLTVGMTVAVMAALLLAPRAQAHRARLYREAIKANRDQLNRDQTTRP